RQGTQRQGSVRGPLSLGEHVRLPPGRNGRARVLPAVCADLRFLRHALAPGSAGGLAQVAAGTRWAPHQRGEQCTGRRGPKGPTPLIRNISTSACVTCRSGPTRNSTPVGAKAVDRLHASDGGGSGGGGCLICPARRPLLNKATVKGRN